MKFSIIASILTIILTLPIFILIVSYLGRMRLFYIKKRRKEKKKQTPRKKENVKPERGRVIKLNSERNRDNIFRNDYERKIR